jgi:hypothetical protein
MDNAQTSSDDILTDATTDNLITLKSPCNIDDTAAQYLYDGSIVQKNGDENYDGGRHRQRGHVFRHHPRRTYCKDVRCSFSILSTWLNW